MKQDLTQALPCTNLRFAVSVNEAHCLHFGDMKHISDQVLKLFIKACGYPETYFEYARDEEHGCLTLVLKDHEAALQLVEDLKVLPMNSDTMSLFACIANSLGGDCYVVMHVFMPEWEARIVAEAVEKTERDRASLHTQSIIARTNWSALEKKAREAAGRLDRLRTIAKQHGM